MNNQLNQSFQKKLALLTISIGLLYFYFGMLKFFPNLSPAEEIGSVTACKLCFGLLNEELCLLSLAFLEVMIGVFLIARKHLKFVIVIAISHLVMTFSPFIFFPDQIFTESIVTPSLLGQYIYKNIIIICALIVIYPGKENKQLSLEVLA